MAYREAGYTVACWSLGFRVGQPRRAIRPLEVSATTNLFKSDTILEHNIEFQQRMLEQVKADWQRQWDVPIVESSVRVVAINGIRTLVMDIVGEHKITLRSMVLFFDDGKTFAVVLVSAGDHASSEIAKVTNSITPNIKFGPQKALGGAGGEESRSRMTVAGVAPNPVARASSDA